MPGLCSKQRQINNTYENHVGVIQSTSTLSACKDDYQGNDEGSQWEKPRYQITESHDRSDLRAYLNWREVPNMWRFIEKEPNTQKLTKGIRSKVQGYAYKYMILG